MISRKYASRADHVAPPEPPSYSKVTIFAGDGTTRVREISQAELQARKRSPVPIQVPPSMWIKRDPLPSVGQRRRTKMERDN